MEGAFPSLLGYHHGGVLIVNLSSLREFFSGYFLYIIPHRISSLSPLVKANLLKFKHREIKSHLDTYLIRVICLFANITIVPLFFKVCIQGNVGHFFKKMGLSDRHSGLKLKLPLTMQIISKVKSLNLTVS